MLSQCVLFFFFFNDTATTEIYTLSLHDALPISPSWSTTTGCPTPTSTSRAFRAWRRRSTRSEEHTSELQSHVNLVCRLLLEKKKNNPFEYSPSPNRCRNLPFLSSAISHTQTALR